MPNYCRLQDIILQEMITIREYTPLDRESLIKLLRLNIPKYFAPEEEQDLIDYLDKHIYSYFVILLHNEIVGAGGFNISEDKTTGILSWDFFHPEHQGAGLGTTFTLYRIKKLKEIKTITKIMVRTSQLAYKFYQKFGFETQEIVKDYWGKDLDLYRMENSLEKIN